MWKLASFERGATSGSRRRLCCHIPQRLLYCATTWSKTLHIPWPVSWPKSRVEGLSDKKILESRTKEEAVTSRLPSWLDSWSPRGTFCAIPYRMPNVTEQVQSRRDQNTNGDNQRPLHSVGAVRLGILDTFRLLSNLVVLCATSSTTNKIS